jgi:hypothetical protein
MIILTERELHLKALEKSEDSQKIYPSMTVIRLGFVTSMLKEMQNDFRKIFEDKDSEILELKKQLNMK